MKLIIYTVIALNIVLLNDSFANKIIFPKLNVLRLKSVHGMWPTVSSLNKTVLPSTSFQLKEKQSVSLIFLSSIFKKNKNYLGIYRFKILQSLTRKKVIALGGISEVNEKKIKLLSCEGISGISYFE